MNYRLDWKALPLQQKSPGAFALSLHPTWWIGRHAICLKMALTMCILIGDYRAHHCMKRVPVQKRISRTFFTSFNWLFSDMRVKTIHAYFFQVHWHLQPRVWGVQQLWLNDGWNRSRKLVRTTRSYGHWVSIGHILAFEPKWIAAMHCP